MHHNGVYTHPDLYPDGLFRKSLCAGNKKCTIMVHDICWICKLTRQAEQSLLA